MTLHVAFVHAFVNPTLFLVLHKGLRKATVDLLCCNFRSSPATPSSGGGGRPRSTRQQQQAAGASDDLLHDEQQPYPLAAPLPPLNNGGTARTGMLEIDSLHPRAYM